VPGRQGATPREAQDPEGWPVEVGNSGEEKVPGTFPLVCGALHADWNSYCSGQACMERIPVFSLTGKQRSDIEPFRCGLRLLPEFGQFQPVF
jgi:hypothetical protein